MKINISISLIALTIINVMMLLVSASVMPTSVLKNAAKVAKVANNAAKASSFTSKVAKAASDSVKASTASSISSKIPTAESIIGKSKYEIYPPS